MKKNLIFCANAMNKINVNSCTDITGYGLLGHLKEMCEASNVSAVIAIKDIPIIDGTNELTLNNINIPGGTKRNFECFNSVVQYQANKQEINELLLYDAQTSGGLLISVPKKNADILLEELKKEKCLAYNVIGQIIKKQPSHLIQVR